MKYSLDTSSFPEEISSLSPSVFLNLYALFIEEGFFVSLCYSLELSVQLDGEGNGTPLQHSCLENPMDGGAMGLLGVGHNRTTSLSLFTFMHWRRKWQLTPIFLPGDSQGWGSLVGCHLWDHTESTCLKWLSNSSSKIGINKVCDWVDIWNQH